MLGLAFVGADLGIPPHIGFGDPYEKEEMRSTPPTRPSTTTKSFWRRMQVF